MLNDEELRRTYRDKAVLVTGGAGFIGSCLVESLVTAGARVRVLDNFSTGNRENLKAVAPRIEVLVGDICDASICEKAARDVEVVFHEAALVSVPESIRDPEQAYRINVIGSSNVFEAACSCSARRLVYASSSAVYGDMTTMPLTESVCGRPLSPYAIGKSTSESIAKYLHATRGLTSVGLRYFNVHGVRQRPDSPYAAAIPLFIAAARAGKSPTIFGDGLQTRDFIHVSDVVRANLLAGVVPGIEAAVLNVGTGVSTTIKELAEQICLHVGKGLAPQYGPARRGDILHSVADTTSAERLLGFRAAVDMRTGLLMLLSGDESTLRPG